MLARGGRVGRGRETVHPRRKDVRWGEGLRLPAELERVVLAPRALLV